MLVLATSKNFAIYSHIEPGWLGHRQSRVWSKAGEEGGVMVKRLILKLVRLLCGRKVGQEVHAEKIVVVVINIDNDNNNQT